MQKLTKKSLSALLLTVFILLLGAASGCSPQPVLVPPPKPAPNLHQEQAPNPNQLLPLQNPFALPQAAAAKNQPPRLVGIMQAPSSTLALLEYQGQQQLCVPGDMLGLYKILHITKYELQLQGPKGMLKLQLPAKDTGERP